MVLPKGKSNLPSKATLQAQRDKFAQDILALEKDMGQLLETSQSFFVQATHLLEEDLKQLPLEAKQRFVEDQQKLSHLKEAITQGKFTTIQENCGLHDETLDWMYHVALARVQEKRLEEAVILLGYLNYLNDRRETSWALLGLCLFHLKCYEEAIPTLQTALERGSKEISTHFLLIQCYLKTGSTTLAKQQWQRLEKLFKDDEAKKEFLAQHPHLKP